MRGPVGFPPGRAAVPLPSARFTPGTPAAPVAGPAGATPAAAVG